MEQNGRARNEVLMAGIGGMGVLVSGQVLLEAAFQRYEHVSYVSSYGFARRGGLCECTVVFSDEKIASPLLDRSHHFLNRKRRIPNQGPQYFLVRELHYNQSPRRQDCCCLYIFLFQCKGPQQLRQQKKLLSIIHKTEFYNLSSFLHPSRILWAKLQLQLRP